MKLDFMNDLTNNGSYVWVPIVVFAALIIIGGLIGFWNGWKTSLYFFGWNLVGVIAGVLSVSSIVKALDGIGILKIVSSSAGTFWGLMILFIFIATTNLFAFIFYWIFRKKLKKSIKENKKAGKSNFSSRFIGMGIAVVSVSPAAVYLADSSAVMSTENGFTKFLDSMTKAYTGGKFEGTSSEREDIGILLGNIDTISKLASAFDGSGDGSELNTQETRDALQDVLNTDFSKNINDIYDGIKNSGMADGLKDADLSSVDPADITKSVPAMGINFQPGKKKELTDSLKDIFGGNDAAVNALVNQLEAKVTA